MRDDAWAAVNSVPVLGAREVHVWRDRFADSPPWVRLDLLTPKERDQAARMGSVRRRAEFVRGRACLRFLVEAYLGGPLAAHAIRVSPAGKPFVDVPGEALQLGVSLAHSGNVLVVAVTRGAEVGVDIEVEDASVDYDSIARRFFSSEESAALAALAPDARVRAFFATWVRKEATLKAMGTGFATPLADLQFAIGSVDLPSLNRLPEGFGRLHDWTVHDLNVKPGMAGAIAVRAAHFELRCLRWTDATWAPEVRRGSEPRSG